DFYGPWGEFQKSFLTQWLDAYGKLNPSWMDPMTYATGMKSPFAAPDIFSRWTEMMRDTLGKLSGQAGGGIGSTVLDRMMRAGGMFVVLNEFWMEILKDLPKLHSVRGDDAGSREIFDRWAEAYKKVFEQLMGSPVSDSADDMMKSWLNILQMHQAALGLWRDPWLKAAPQWQEYAEKWMKGDMSALAEGRSLWRDVYDETLGRVFRMPAFGLTKDQTEKIRKTYDVFIQFHMALPNFHKYFYDTGMAALNALFGKIRSLRHEEFTPDTVKEIYKMWVITNEDAYFELFKQPDFSNAMGEVLNLGLRLKKHLDGLTADWCESVSIPSNREFDSVARAVQELRRKVRSQQKAIEALQQQLETKKKGGGKE
ncbi:MAG: poly(R)-hydroxyalkanoic acid synthase subunit PhaE, partial [Thermodesulfobacteriota bacterium]